EPRPGEAGEVAGILDLTENVGADSHVHLRLPCGAAIVAQLPTRSVVGLEPGAALRLFPASADVYLFDPETGAAIEVVATEPVR
ncbi:MAG TPA: TOBE domain-containing protein, partial [Polyangia bacterium]|nr:TOBE domain-containing protein [Polyangia bacterium]